MFAFNLYLARHGQTEWNAEQRMQGRLNSPLTGQGSREAEALGVVLARLDLTALELRISPQGRVVQTAAIALGGGHVPLRTDDRLMEIDIGDWSGLTRGQVMEARPDLFSDDPATRLAWYDAAPGGEGMAGLEARCRALLDDLSGPAVLITHGITLRMLRSLALCGTAALFGEGRNIAQGVVYRCSKGHLSTLAEGD